MAYHAIDTQQVDKQAQSDCTTHGPAVVLMKLIGQFKTHQCVLDFDYKKFLCRFQLVRTFFGACESLPTSRNFGFGGIPKLLLPTQPTIFLRSAISANFVSNSANLSLLRKLCHRFRFR
jgi:hypothetical protein